MNHKRRDGIILHRMIRTMEELSIGFQRLGLSKRKSDSQALIAAFILEGWPQEEAERYANTFFGGQE